MFWAFLGGIFGARLGAFWRHFCGEFWGVFWGTFSALFGAFLGVFWGAILRVWLALGNDLCVPKCICALGELLSTLMELILNDHAARKGC